MPSTSSITIRQAVGLNVRRLRDDAKLTAEELARALRANGLRWNATRVGELERGEKAIGIPELLVLAYVLDQHAGGVTLPDLFHGSETVELNPDATISTHEIDKAFRGREYVINSPEGRGPRGTPVVSQDVWVKYAPGKSGFIQGVVMAGTGAADRNVARALDVPLAVVMAASAGLWGESLTDRRDQVAGKDATPQRRGHVTRELQDELQAYIRRRNGDD